MVLDGEAGIGKSRLAWEFEKYVDGLAASVLWHRGRCLSYGDGVAFWALAEAMRARFGLVEADAGDTVTERLDAGLAEFVPDESDRDWLRPRLAVLLGAPDGTARSRGRTCSRRGRRSWSTWPQRRRSVVLVVDDAQHADEGLLDFLDHLLAYRPGADLRAGAGPSRAPGAASGAGWAPDDVVRLDPLDDVAMANLVDGLVAGLPAASRAALVDRAEGIPLFAVETVRALIDRDLVVPRDGRYVPAERCRLWTWTRSARRRRCRRWSRRASMR